MTSWKKAFHGSLWSGSAAAVLSGIALAVCGKVENDTAAGPLNGPSQWIWGRHASRRRGPTLRHTLVGYSIHHLASIGWAVLHEKHVASRVEGRGLLANLVAGSATAAFACAVDYRVARGRLQPGFDRHLSRASLAIVYAAFGVGLALGCHGRARAGSLAAIQRAKRTSAAPTYTTDPGTHMMRPPSC